MNHYFCLLLNENGPHWFSMDAQHKPSHRGEQPLPPPPELSHLDEYKVVHDEITLY